MLKPFKGALRLHLCYYLLFPALKILPCKKSLYFPCRLWTVFNSNLVKLIDYSTCTVQNTSTLEVSLPLFAMPVNQANAWHTILNIYILALILVIRSGRWFPQSNSHIGIVETYSQKFAPRFQPISKTVCEMLASIFPPFAPAAWIYSYDLRLAHSYSSVSRDWV